jgi:hypothetical protein
MFVPRAYLRDLLPSVTPDADARVDDAARFVQAEVALAPLHLRVPILFLGTVFFLWFGGARLAGCSIPFAETTWERFGGAPARALTRLIRSLALLRLAESERTP